MTCRSAVATVGLLICAGHSYGQSVHLHKHDATVWSTRQLLSGHFEDAGPSGVLYVDTTAIQFVAAFDSFDVTFDIGAGSHLVYACGETGQEPVCSDTLRLKLGFDPKPEVYAWAEVGDATVFLHARILDDAGPSHVDLRPVVYPNPFADQTVIQFVLDRPGRVTLTVFDLLGRSVADVVDGELSMGIHRIDLGTAHLTPGAYLYRLEADGRTESGMMIKSQ